MSKSSFRRDVFPRMKPPSCALCWLRTPWLRTPFCPPRPRLSFFRSLTASDDPAPLQHEDSNFKNCLPHGADHQQIIELHLKILGIIPPVKKPLLSIAEANAGDCPLPTNERDPVEEILRFKFNDHPEDSLNQLLAKTKKQNAAGEKKKQLTIITDLDDERVDMQSGRRDVLRFLLDDAAKDKRLSRISSAGLDDEEQWVEVSPSSKIGCHARGNRAPDISDPRKNISVKNNNESLKTLLTEMLGELMRLQRRAMDDRNAMAQRRIIVGLKEVEKGIRAHRVKMVVLANNLNALNGSVDEKLHAIIGLTHHENIPVLFEFSRRGLGRALGMSVKVAAVGIQNTDGVHQQFRAVEKHASGTTKDVHYSHRSSHRSPSPRKHTPRASQRTLGDFMTP